MKKYIKFTLISFFELIILASVSYAETLPLTISPEKTNESVKEYLTQEEKDTLKNELDLKKEEIQTAIEAQRAQFNLQFELKKEGMKKSIDASNTKLKVSILKIKDDKKRETVQNIISKIADLNAKAVNNLNNLINNIEDDLGKIEIQTNEEEAKGTDVTTTRTIIAKTKIAINDVKSAILIQSTKIYSADIITENLLQSMMINVKENLNTDIKILREKVKTAHNLAKEAVMSLPQTSKDDQTTVNNNTNTKVEEGNTPISNITN